MAINIKELFSGDSSNIQLDKINYNFDQIVANGGGPIGLTGSKGDVGPQGSKGDKGDTGAQGVKGDPGAATDYFAREEYSSDYYSLAPLSDPNHGGPAAMVLGYTIAPGDSPEDLGDEVPLKLYSRLSGALRLADMNSSFYVDLESRQSGSNFVLNFNKSPLGSGNYIYTFNGEILNLKSGGINKVSLGSTTSTFSSALVLNSGLKITTGAGAGKYLKSDASGNATWSTLSTAVPIGTIVMVSKFVLESSVNFLGNSSPGGPVLASGDYKGRGYGDWAGWYYCWGKTWGTYETPDLRERYPIGYVNTSISYSGYSTDVTSVAVGDGSASDLSVAGYFGVNDVDNLQSTQTASGHSHTVSTTAKVEPGGGSSTLYAVTTNNAYGAVTSSISGSKTTDISPRSAVVGFMIYLGSDNLSYGGIGGSQGSQSIYSGQQSA